MHERMSQIVKYFLPFRPRKKYDTKPKLIASIEFSRLPMAPHYV
jgi:hypothetical protein